VSRLDPLPTLLRDAARLRLLDIDRLYRYTREHTADVRPWMCDARGVAVVLDARYAFIDLYMRHEGRLGTAQIRDSEYWRLISLPIGTCPRDGGPTWQYADPDAQAERFMALIASVLQYGYVRSPQSPVVLRFEDESASHVEVDAAGNTNRLHYGGRQFAGLMTVLRHRTYYSVLNGLHRLTLLKYLRDTRRGSRVVPVLKVG